VPQLGNVVVVSLCGVSGNTPYWVLLLGLCGASGNTLYWVLFFGLRGPRETHITWYYCWFMWDIGQHTLLGIVVGLCGISGNTLYWVLLFRLRGPRATHITGYGCWFMWGFGQHTHNQNHMSLLPYFLINLFYKLATIRQISYSQTCTSPPKPSEEREYSSNNYISVLTALEPYRNVD
jgi:hypothetical protein